MDDVALDTSTSLALQRTGLAVERTLMGWIRTALSMISFGFTIGKLGEALAEVKGLFRLRTFSVKGLADFLVIVGTVTLLLAAFQHWNRMRELRRMGLPRKPSLAFVVALLLAALGGFALTALVLAL
jgi:putative membrane protein